MAKLKVFNMDGKAVSEITLKDELFAIEYNEPLIHEVVVAYNANQRQGTKSTLTTSEVRGHAKKPYRQKKTGRARHGNTKSPLHEGGGVAFAPKPRDFSKKVNKQAKRTALFSAFSEKIRQGEVTVLSEFAFAEMKTKHARGFLSNFKFDKKTVVIVDKCTEELVKIVRNIKILTVEDVKLLNVYELVANKNVVITKAALKGIEEVYKD